MAVENSIRRLPFSLEAEQSVLGAILIDPEALSEVDPILTVGDFYLKEHQEIFSAMKKLFIQSRTIDPVTLMDALVQENVYNAEESKNYIRTLAEIVPNSSNVRDYAGIVRDKSTLRRLIQAAGEISEMAYSEQGSATDIVDLAESMIFRITQSRDVQDFVHIRDVLLSTYKQLKENAANGGKPVGMPTGYSALDGKLHGMGRGNLVILGARPAMGKTSFAMNVAVQASKISKKSVCVFSLEMNNVELGLRILSFEALVPNSVLQSGLLSPEDWTRVAHAAEVLSGIDFYFDESHSITVSNIKSKLRRMKNLGLVVIDHLGLLRPESSNKSDTRAGEVGAITRELKVMAKELDIPVLCCAQLNRQVANTKDHRPGLSDLRESGSIEQDADVVLFIHREFYYTHDPESERQAEVIVAKNRHGETGKVDMTFLSEYTLFTQQENNMG